MALTQRLEIRQSQALVMTPQLMQAIKLLELSNVDLASYVEGELERNPLLEHVGESEPGADTAANNGSALANDQQVARAEASLRTADEAQEASGDYDDALSADGGATSSQRDAGDAPHYANWSGPQSQGEDHNLEAYVAAETTLAAHLAEQLSLAVIDPARRVIGQYLIDLVDEAGYLSGDLAAAAEKLGTSPSEVNVVLAILQSFDPPGVCARNVAECLALQLKERDRFDPAMQMLVEHLDLLARREFASLRKICGVSEEDLTEMIGEIRQLNPKPGLAFGSVLVQPVVPDVFVRSAPDGSFIVELNSDTLPKVLVNQEYHSEVVKTARGAKEKSYVAECLQTATWLVRALDQRAKTILKVASEIVRQQDGFLAHGVQHLRPLNLRAIAEAIGMHESTVSRVTANKYIATSRGIFELKYFFTSAIQAADGGQAHSAEAVRHRIRQMINDEPPEYVLSDDTIAEKLHAAGIGIARRTVAKYREAMRIPSSVQRRREKQTIPCVLS